MSNIKVKTIDDLDQLVNDSELDINRVKGSDVFIVSHQTNENP